MTSWPPIDSLAEVGLDVIGSFQPKQVLYEFDGPCIFTTVTPHGLLFLAYLSEDLEDKKLLRFIVSTSSEQTISELKDGAVTVREALDRGTLWIVDVDYAYVPKRAAVVAVDQLPEDALPPHSTMLRADLEPAMIVRLEGTEIRQGAIPAAVFLQAAEIAGKGLKPVFDWAAREQRQDRSGRPPEWLRDLYGLPAQRFAFGSLEVAFRAVDVTAEQQTTLPLDAAGIQTPRQIQRDAWQAIREGIEWAASGNDALPSSRNDEKWRAILESIKRMTPASTGPVDSIKVWGQALGRLKNAFELDRSAAKRIRSRLTELKKAQEVQLRVFTGRVRDLDLDRLTFIMRDVPHMDGDVGLELDDVQLLEVAREAHYQELDVSVVARSEDNKRWTATDIEFV
ncbi:MAG: hypothetical protein KAI66_27275 [Lentisphaeria bacterium]|nr:hypothetical protein [Lentisphaeria bacterium]